LTLDTHGAALPWIKQLIERSDSVFSLLIALFEKAIQQEEVIAHLEEEIAELGEKARASASDTAQDDQDRASHSDAPNAMPMWAQQLAKRLRIVEEHLARSQ